MIGITPYHCMVPLDVGLFSTNRGKKEGKKGKNNFRLFSFLSQGFWGIPEFDGLLRRWRIAGVEGRWVAYSIRISVGGQLAIRAAPVTVCTGYSGTIPVIPELVA